MSKSGFFQGKAAIVTGASSGIGEATAVLMAEYGAKVALVARRTAKIEALRDKIISRGGVALAIPADIAIQSDMERMAETVISAWGTVDILIANARLYVQARSQNLDLSDFELAMNVNYYGTLNTIKGVLSHMLERESGHIVITNSLDSKKGVVGDGPYVAAKSALRGFGDVLRQELKASGVSVTSVFPGRIDTPMIDHLDVPWASPKISAEKVAKAIAKGIINKKASVTVPRIYTPVGALNDLYPRFMDRAYYLLKLEGNPSRPKADNN